VLAPSCESSAGKADPAVRLKAFFDAFPQRNTVTTICNQDLSDALVQIAELLALAIGTPCLDGDLPDIDPSTPGLQPDCIVSDVVNPGASQQETVMPRCNNTSNPASSTNLPCWHTVVDTMECTGTPTNLKLVIERGGREPATGTYTDARCVAH
jgi:hypothetical protein